MSDVVGVCFGRLNEVDTSDHHFSKTAHCGRQEGEEDSHDPAGNSHFEAKLSRWDKRDERLQRTGGSGNKQYRIQKEKELQRMGGFFGNAVAESAGVRVGCLAGREGVDGHETHSVVSLAIIHVRWDVNSHFVPASLFTWKVRFHDITVVSELELLRITDGVLAPAGALTGFSLVARHKDASRIGEKCVLHVTDAASTTSLGSAYHPSLASMKRISVSCREIQRMPLWAPRNEEKSLKR